MPNATTLLLTALLTLTPGALQEPADDGSMGWTGVLDEASFAALHELREGEAPALRGEEVQVGDTRAYLSLPEVVEPIGAVVVIHEWWGLNQHIEHWADRLAADGYVALAVDLYGGKVATTREEAMAAMRAVDEAAALETLRLAHAFLLEDERVRAERTACIGWCFGGGWSLRLAMAEPELDAAVVYYGRLVTDVERLAEIEAPVLGVFAENDQGIPPSAVKEFAAAMEQAGKRLELHSYDAEHAFANPSSARYDAEHAAEAWRETRGFLVRNLWPPQPEGRFSDGSRKLVAHPPGGWDGADPRPMRLETWTLGADTECYVVALAGDGGGLKANLDRWRAQLGQAALAEDELDALPRVPMLGTLAVTMRVEGDYTGMRGDKLEGAVLLGAVCELDGEALFVKLLGPASEVDDRAGEFLAFCQGLR